MSAVSEHHETEAMDDAAAMEVDVSWLFPEPPAEASVEAGSSSGNQRHKRRQRAAKPRTARRHSPARDEEISQPTVEAGPSSRTPPHSRRGRAPAATGRAAHRYNPNSDDFLLRATIFILRQKGSRLMQAAEKGAVEEVRTELAAGADMEERDKFYWGTVLHCAARNGHAEVVRCLLEHGAEVDATNAWNQTPLHAAVQTFGKVVEECRRAAVVRVLLASSADPNARDMWKRTPLHWAAEHGEAEIAAALLDAGADRAARDRELDTPLDIARQNRRQQLIEMLKTLPEELKNNLMKRLFIAAKSGSVKEIWALLDAGAPINGRDGDGNTALHIATRENHAATVKFLINAGADVNVRNSNQQTPLHRAVYASDVHVMWTLLAASACKDAQDKDGNTPLHLAATYNTPYKEKVKALLLAGAKRNIKNNRGSKPDFYGVDSSIKPLVDIY